MSKKIRITFWHFRADWDTPAMIMTVETSSVVSAMKIKSGGYKKIGDKNLSFCRGALPGGSTAWEH